MPPFKSESQKSWMFANHPAMARRWARHTPNMKSLPKRVMPNDLVERGRKHVAD